MFNMFAITGLPVWWCFVEFSCLGEGWLRGCIIFTFETNVTVNKRYEKRFRFRYDVLRGDIP